MVHGFNHSSSSFNFQQHRVTVIGDYFHFQQLFNDVVNIDGMGGEGAEITDGYMSVVLYLYSEVNKPYRLSIQSSLKNKYNVNYEKYNRVSKWKSLVFICIFL
jgi:hypothetical protein